MIPGVVDDDEWSMLGVTALGLVFLAIGAAGVAVATGAVVGATITVARMVKGRDR